LVILNKPDDRLQDLLKREGISFRIADTTGKYLFVTRSEKHLIVADFRDAPIEFKSHLKKIRYIAPDRSGVLDKVGVVDINTACFVPDSANFGVSDKGKGVIYYNEIPGKGKIFVLPFHLDILLKHRGIVPKRFWAPFPRFPYEDVAVTDRGGVRRLLTACLKYLCEINELPFVKTSCNPGSFPSTLGFRVDTDFSSPSLIEKALKISEKVGMRWTWFVTTGDQHARLKAIISILKGEDIQLHCHRHLVYADITQNKLNYARGKDILNQLGVAPTGVAAPYGEWNESLQQAYTELGFLYSSEFGYSYDDLPELPMVNGQRSTVLQIPVHPISLGRLSEVTRNKKQIFDYYSRIIDLQCARLEPCFFYDHPKWIVHYQDVLIDILQYGLERCRNWTTLTDYCHWWQRRDSINYEIQLKEEGFDLKATETPAEISLTIERNGQIAFVPIKTQMISWDELKWSEIYQTKRFNIQELNTRKSDLIMLIKAKLRNYRRKMEKRINSQL